MIDAHTHLDFPAFDADRDEVLQRARSVGVETCIVPGVSPATWSRAASLGLPWCAGLHPAWIESYEGSPSTLETLLLQQTSCVAVGEFGLDQRVHIGQAQQLRYAEAQLRAAAVLQLPVVLHVVGRHGAMIELLEAHAPLRGMVHAFSGSAEIATRYVALGLNVSFGGTLSKVRSAAKLAAAKAVPIDRLLVETDAPDLAPEGAPFERNEPSLLPLIVDRLATLRNEERDVVAARTADNARALFHLR